MMSRMPVTTADVAAWPTPAALRSDCNPRRHPDKPMMTPKVAALISPVPRSERSIIDLVSDQYRLVGISRIDHEMSMPPRMPRKFE